MTPDGQVIDPALAAPGHAGLAGLAGRPGSARLRLAQMAGVLRLDLRRLLWSRGALGALFLALPPIAVMLGWAVVVRFFERMPFAEAPTVFATMFRGFLVPMALFFGCVVVFANLIRRETRERTLHYWCLTPIRRDLLLVAKYVAGVLATFFVFGLTTVVTYALTFAPYVGIEPQALSRFFFEGPGFAHLAAYLGVTLLACVGYGAVFLALAMFFKRSILPALAVYGWEWLSFLLPPALKKATVIYWLGGLIPVPVSEGALALLAEPAPAWLAVPGLLAFVAVLLALAVWRMRRMEVLYSED